MPDLKVLLDEFIDSLTPAHHKAAAVPFANVEVSFQNLRSAAEALLAKAGVGSESAPEPTKASGKSKTSATDPTAPQTA